MAAQAEESAIHAEGLSYSYGETRAVDSVSFAVAPGEIVGFLGPNGAGKSTTIKMLTGQLTPQQGTVTILGKDATCEREEIQGKIGVSFEEKNLYGEMTARENLQFHGRLFGIRNVDVEALLRRVDLVDRMNDRVSSYSKGMQQRLMVARCLVNEPSVLFLDEPTSGLDPVSSRAIRSIVRKEADRGAAVLLTTHDMNEADQLSDRVAFINEGRILAIDTPENLKLAHGERSVRVRSDRGDEIVETVIGLEEEDASSRVEQAIAAGGLRSVHTQEASLEEIFIKFAGRGLAE